MGAVSVAALGDREQEPVRSYGGSVRVSTQEGNGSVTIQKAGHKKILPLRVMRSKYTHFDEPFVNVSFKITAETSSEATIRWTTPSHADDGINIGIFHYDYLD